MIGSDQPKSLGELLKAENASPARPNKVVHAAISRKISGCNSANRMSVLAAPLGSRRPCSHCSSVRLETPRRAANCACVRPDFRRARAIGERGSTFNRLPPPALISRAPSRTSCQISRFASKRASARPVRVLTHIGTSSSVVYFGSPAMAG